MAGQQGSEEVAISTSVLVLHGLLERAKQRPVRQGSDPIVQPTGTFLVRPERLLALLAISFDSACATMPKSLAARGQKPSAHLDLIALKEARGGFPI